MAGRDPSPSTSGPRRPEAKRHRSTAESAVEAWSQRVPEATAEEMLPHVESLPEALPTAGMGPGYLLPTISASMDTSLDARRSPSPLTSPRLDTAGRLDDALQSLPMVAFLESYPHPVFALQAEPLHAAICARVPVGRAEDPEAGGELAASDGLAYPGVTGKQADAGRTTTLKQVLRPAWTNAACIAAGGAEGPAAWFDQRQLSRWIEWVREGFERLEDAGDHGTQDVSRSFARAFESGPIKGTTEGLIILATLVDAGSAPATASSELKSSDYLVLTTTVVAVSAVPTRPGPSPLTHGDRLLSSDSATSSTGTVRGLQQLSTSHAATVSPRHAKRVPASEPRTWLAPTLRQPAGFLTERQARRKVRSSSSWTAQIGASDRKRSSSRADGKRRSADPGDEARGDDSMDTDESFVGSRRPSATTTESDSGQMSLDDPLTSGPAPSYDSAFDAALAVSPMGRMILAKDWTMNPLGPMDSWTPTLKTMVALAIGSPYRMSLLWGPDCVMLYNDEYRKSAGSKHPKLLGQSGSEGWAEVWTDLGSVADKVLLGEPYTVYDSLLFFDRHPADPKGLRAEETYHSFSWLPVRAPDGTIEGIWNIAWETTARVIAERRLSTLRNLVQATLVSRTRKDYCAGCLQGLAQNPYDIPFIIMYTCEVLAKSSSKKQSSTATGDDDLSEASSATGKMTIQLDLAGSIGIPPGHSSAPSTVEVTVPTNADSWTASEASMAGLAAHTASSVGGQPPGSISSASSSQNTLKMEFSADDDHPWPFHEACALGKPIYVSNLAGRTGEFEVRAWDDPTRAAVVMPIISGDGGTPLAVVVFGLSPRLYWNETYALFLNMLSRQFANGLSTVIGQEEEARRMEDLAALDRAKTTFFSNISHELRTPLTLVIGPVTEILEASDDAVSPSAKDRLKVVKRNTERLINLVNQLLDLSRFEAGRMAARFRPTKVTQMVADIASLFRSAMTKNNIKLVLDCPTHVDTVVYVDRDLMEKVLFNLLSNALKFTREGGSVTVRVSFDSTRCYITCTDTGVGIARSELPRIFERFHRVEDSARQAEGTGIGLALARDIANIHGGKLDAESEVGRGTTFRCTLYLGTSHLPPECVDSSADSAIDRSHDMIVASDARRWMLGDIEGLAPMPSEGSSSEGSTGRGAWDLAAPSDAAKAGEADVLTTRGSLICLADDNADMQAYVASILGRHYRVHRVSNGEEALEWCTENQPDLILSDVMMPKLDGFQLLRRLKSSPVTAHASVILLSARAGSEARVDGLAAGADDYLVKPFEAKELLARVNTHLQLAKVRQKLEQSVRDRTRQLVESEIKLRELAQSFQSITMLSPVGIFQCNPLGELVFANKAWYQQSGHPKSEPLSAWWDQVDEADRPHLQSRFMQMVAARTEGRGELRWRNGRESSWDFMSLFNDEGALIGFLGSTADITDRKAAERQAVEEAEQRARDALESKRQHEEFVDMASHELRNPLSGIVQAAELLNSSLRLMLTIAQQETPPSTDQIRRLENEIEEDLDAVEGIQLCSTQQLRIANDIIEVSKLSMGLLSVARVDFDLLGRMREIVSMFRISARREGIDFGIRAGPNLRRAQMVNADPNRLAQVVINFLGNSLRYTARSSGDKRVTILVDILDSVPPIKSNARRIGDIRVAAADAGDDLVYARVGVQDTAQGLAPDDLSRLFERFAQANPTVDQYSGQGLGLYVSRHLVDLHGGFIEVESVLGAGSTFSFIIPARRTFVLSPSADVPADPLKDLSVSGVAMTEGSSTSTPAGSRLREPASTGNAARHILLVEDNVINIKVLKRQLNLKGYEVSVAMDGRQGLDCLYADDAGTSDLPRVDAVLMDIQMPVMDGLQAITELRAAEKAKRVKRRYPVIAVTGNARKEQVEHFLASGFDEICVKPYRIDDVVGNIEKLFVAPTGLRPAYGTSAASTMGM